MRRVITGVAVVALLAGPTALAFPQGGYFDLARLVAALVAWLLFAVAALVSPQPLPRGLGGRLALGGLVLLAAWSGASIGWAPQSAPATDALERLLLYVAALGAAAALLRTRTAQWVAEPALALGALVVVAYGMLDRLLPGIFDLPRSNFALGRLDQPLTYWNAMGALAALGVLLCARLAGDDSRPPWMRAAAAAGGVPLALGVWLSYSRGVWAALAVGLLALAALALTRAQLRALAVAALAGTGALLVANSLEGVRALEGSSAARERDGLVMLVVLAALCALAAAATWLAARAEARGTLSPRPIVLPRWAVLAIAGTVVAAGAGVLALAARDRGHPAAGASAQRLRSLESNRYDYWKVALDHGLRPHPLRGVGAGGFAVIWLEYRDVPERTRVAHSLYVETLGELGLAGFLFLALFVGGLAIAARRALRTDAVRAAGPVAALVLWGTHSGLDWDWEMPALTLVALALAGLLVAISESRGAEGGLA